MSIFGKILSKLGIKKDKAKEEAAPKKPAPKKVSGGRGVARQSMKKPSNMPTGRSKSSAMEMVDVMSKLESMSEGSGLNWKKSIVDLLKVLDIDSSRTARNELAKELGCPADKMSDSAKMNTWLHKTVLQQIAANGGNVPKSLLD